MPPIPGGESPGAVGALQPQSRFCQGPEDQAVQHDGGPAVCRVGVSGTSHSALGDASNIARLDSVNYNNCINIKIYLRP